MKFQVGHFIATYVSPPRARTEKSEGCWFEKQYPIFCYSRREHMPFLLCVVVCPSVLVRIPNGMSHITMKVMTRYLGILASLATRPAGFLAIYVHGGHNLPHHDGHNRIGSPPQHTTSTSHSFWIFFSLSLTRPLKKKREYYYNQPKSQGKKWTAKGFWNNLFGTVPNDRLNKKNSNNNSKDEESHEKSQACFPSKSYQKEPFVRRDGESQGSLRLCDAQGGSQENRQC